MGRSKLDIKLKGAGGVKLGELGLFAALSSQLDSIFVVKRSAGNDRGQTTVDEATGSGNGRRVANAAPTTCGKAVCVVEARDSALGMAHSITAGLQAALSSKAPLDAVIVMLADQPLISGSMIGALIRRFREEKNLDFVAYSNGNSLLPPVLLASSMFGELERLKGDAGARRLLSGDQWRGSVIPCEEPWRLLDVDTEDDLKELETRLASIHVKAGDRH